MLPEMQLSQFSPTWAFFPPLLQWQFLAGLVPGGETARGVRFLGQRRRASPRAELAWHRLWWALQGCSEEGDTQGKLCSLDLSPWCHSAFGMSGALKEPKSVCTWSDGDMGAAGWCLSWVDRALGTKRRVTAELPAGAFSGFNPGIC